MHGGHIESGLSLQNMITLWQKELSCNMTKDYVISYATSNFCGYVMLCHVLSTHRKKNAQKRLIFLTFPVVRSSSNSTTIYLFSLSMTKWLFISLPSLFLTFHTLLSFNPFFIFCPFQWEKSLSSLVVLMFCCLICQTWGLLVAQYSTLMNWTCFSLENICVERNSYNSVTSWNFTSHEILLHMPFYQCHVMITLLYKLLTKFRGFKDLSPFSILATKIESMMLSL